jgi:hypothetical protein
MAKMEMDIINTQCAGIDIGSRSHFVAVGQSLAHLITDTYKRPGYSTPLNAATEISMGSTAE